MAKLPMEKLTLIGYDKTNVVHTFSSSATSWTADQDCYLVGTIYYTENALDSNDANVLVDSVKLASVQMKGIGSSTSKDFPLGIFLPIKKNQVISIRSNGYNYIKCYGLKA